MLKTIFSNKKLLQHRIDILLIVILVALVIISASQLIATYNSTVYAYDDAIYLNVVDNIRKGNGFVMSIVYPVTFYESNQAWFKTYNPNVILEQSPSLFTPYHKSPLFFLVLAGFFEITHADVTNWILLSSIFNIIINIIFICFYFFWVKKYFGHLISFISSVVITTFPVFLVHLTIADMYPLSALFVLIAFYFTNKTKKDYILFGLFSAFAVLSNQNGIIPIIAYSTFLLIKKEFRGLLSVVGVWIVVVLPWMIYSHIKVHDLGAGMGVPFINNISSLINSVFSHNKQFTDTIFSGGNMHLSDPSILPMKTFSQLLPYGFDATSIVVTIIFFSIFAFISIRNLNQINHRKGLIYLFLGCIFILSSIFYLNWRNTELTNTVDFIVQALLLFGTPIFICTLLWLKKSVIIEKNIPRIFLIILFFSLYAILSVFYLSLFWIGVHQKFLFQMYFLALPIGIYGISRIIHLLPNYRILSNQKFVVLFVPLILVPLLILPYTYTIPELQNYGNTKCPRDVCEYILQHFDRNVVIATDNPGPFFVATGNPTVALGDIDTFSSIGYENYVSIYGIKYVVINDLRYLQTLGLIPPTYILYNSTESGYYIIQASYLLG